MHGKELSSSLDKIHVLQLGERNWNELYRLPATVIIEYAEVFTDSSTKDYDIVFLDRIPLDEEVEHLYRVTKAYTLFVTEKVKACGRIKWLFICRKAQYIDTNNVQDFLLKEVKYYFPESYGEKFEPNDIAIQRNFHGFVKWNGKCNVTLEGSFGKKMRQVALWRKNIPVFREQTIDLWLEYRRDPSVSISLVVTRFAWGSVSDILERWEFSETDLEHIVQIEGGSQDGFICVSLYAKGRGVLQIIALHDRYSRGSHGYFLPGGERYVTSAREEIFCYFEPGDLQPPLNVYFDGYRTREGFEGYSLMKRMGCPFLLLSESRLEGGCLHIGSSEYENMLKDIIKKYVTELGFTSEQVIFSGVSGGAYGALYYGCDIRPHAVIIGKPLASMGSVAANEKYFRPGGFPQSLDMLLYLCDDTDSIAVNKLNNRFWNKFDSADWSNTKFIVVYMIEDDYDSNAYDTLISHLWSGGVQVYGKGIHGRNGDNDLAVMQWFRNQFEKVLDEDFARGVEK